MDLLSNRTVIFANSSLESELSKIFYLLNRDSPEKDKIVQEYKITDVKSTLDSIKSRLACAIVIGC